MSGHRPAGSADLLRAYLALDSSAVSDALDGVGLPPGVGGLGPMWAGARMAGFAVTVELEPRASAPGPGVCVCVGAGAGVGAGAHILTTAVATATEHDVIVVANGGRTDVSGWGGLLSLGASRRGLRGAVVDGACRDIDQARELRFPVYARGLVPVTARGRLQQRSSGGTVRIGGVPVDQGDVVLADETGVVFVPRGRVEEVLPGAGPAPPLRDGGRIPLDHTEPSFDLTTLLNGFRPLFAVLQPADLNKLSANLIEVMQSTKPRVEPLLAQVAQVTNNFADRDKILGDVIVNLNSVLSQVGGKGPEIDALLDQSSRLIGGLKARSGTLVDSLDQTQRLAGKANDLITDLRPTLEHGIPHVREGIAVFHDNRKLLSQTVYAFPYFLGTLGKATQFGSWLTLYACDASLVTGPVTIPIALPGHAPTHTEVCR